MLFYSPDPTATVDLVGKSCINNNLIGYKIHKNPEFVVLDLVVGSGEQDIFLEITLITTSELNMTRQITGRAHLMINLSHTL